MSAHTTRALRAALLSPEAAKVRAAYAPPHLLAGSERDIARFAAELHDGDPEPWPEPEPIPSALPPVPTLDAHMLPESLRPAAHDMAERMQVPLDFPAAGLVVALAGATGRRFRIQPKAHDSGWRVTPNLWGAIVARPGFMKSPLIDEVTRPLREIEARWAEQNREQIGPYEREAEEHKLRLAAWAEAFKAAAKNPGRSVPEHPGQAPEPPTRRRAVVNDATVEKLHEVMTQNPEGVLLLRDELVGWLASLDRPGNEGARQFHLEAWNGSGSHVVDRIGRGTLGGFLCESIFGGIQPSRLQTYVAAAVNGYAGDDGLIQRFQVLVWPDASRDWTLVDRVPDAEALSRVTRVFERIAEIEADAERVLRFEAEAQALFYEWLGALEGRIRGDDLHPAMASHLAKFRSLMPTLAGLFCLADWAAEGGTADPPGQIGLEHARLAAEWCDYLEHHANRVYACISNARWVRAADLGAKIRKGQLGAVLSLRDVYRRGWSGLASPDDARAACDELVGLGWLRRVIPESGAVGRPAEQFEVNPAVLS